MTLPAHELRRLRSVASGAEDLERLVALRLAGEPLAYLEGTAAFGPLELVVDERVLVPRPETEQLWELATGLVDAPDLIVDLCTGSGALALALAGQARVLATDVSPGAVEVARINAARLGVRVEVMQGDLFEPLPPEIKGQVDLVVANPPYVAEREWTLLPADVRREPRIALVAGPTGTEVIERIAADVGNWLRPGGWVAIEIGETQGRRSAGFLGRRLESVEIRKDLAGRERFVVGRRP